MLTTIINLGIVPAVNADRAMNENKNLLSASFDQETSCEGSQMTERSVQHENYKRGRHNNRKRHRKHRSHRLELEQLFDVHSNQSLGELTSMILKKILSFTSLVDDAYEKLNQLTNRNSKAREALLKIQESAFELKAEVKTKDL